MSNGARPSFAATGVAGLDDILGGGSPNRLTLLIEGTRGSARRRWRCSSCWRARGAGERGSTSRSPRPTRSCGRSRASHGWSLDGIDDPRAGAAARALPADEQNTMFHPSEVELGETTKARPRRGRADQARRGVVFDSLSEMRLLAQSPLRYRRQILALKQFFAGRSCTVLLLDDRTADGRRPAAAEHRARRRQPGAARPRVRRRAPAAARHEVARRATSAAATTTSSSDAAASRSSRGWSRPSTRGRSSREPCSSGHRRARRAAGRRPRPRAPARCCIGPAGHGQVDARRAVRVAAAGARRAGGLFHLRRELATLDGARRGRWAWTSPAHVEAGRIAHPADRPGRALARRVRPRRAPARSSSDGRAGRRHRQPQRLPATPCPRSGS